MQHTQSNPGVYVTPQEYLKMQHTRALCARSSLAERGAGGCVTRYYATHPRSRQAIACGFYWRHCRPGEY